MEELKAKIQQLVSEAGAGASFASLMERFCQALEAHPEALGALSGSYRLKTTDTGVDLGFALGENSFRRLEENEKADAILSGKEADLLALIRRELNPMTAMFTGKLNVKGSMQALAKFAQVL